VGSAGIPSEPLLFCERAEELLAITREQRITTFQSIGMVYHGWCRVAQHNDEEGFALIETGLRDFRGIASTRVPFLLLLEADAYGRARQPEVGLQRIDEAIKLVHLKNDRWAEAEIMRVRGELLLAHGDTALAEESLLCALTVARRQSAKLWELRASADLARLWRDQGKHSEARNLLAAIYGWFTEGFDTADLKEAKALLDTLK
jgi:predicted ATPase